MPKASGAVTLLALGALSIAMVTACSDDEPQVTADCAVKQADGSYKAVDDRHCNSGGGGSSGGGAFIWMYGSTRAADGRLTGGTITRPAAGNIATRSGTVIRGGFGGHGGSGS
ncbi:hypothetical protein [Sphaerisporangium sp. TRM90804]|uniref:hypothetical protein n=1 Tax=Sphaerisporangium sp. TRM90804 TaxID=3031113 RepID=UPI0024475394|nr:hypothetical protein [Sphaerisporangium sp. TRM90804]MDH2424841.1 hypothetical protein [Sphaerisporangium sp. TRM90804]